MLAVDERLAVAVIHDLHTKGRARKSENPCVAGM
jgi:hypothetical protein